MKSWNSKLNPFGNYDDPKPPVWFKPEWSYWKRWLWWFFVRNPLHNFMAYWIGFKGANLDYSQIWNKKQKWNLVLPFFSYKSKSLEFYIGWRPDSKMLGFALRIKKGGEVWRKT